MRFKLSDVNTDFFWAHVKRTRHGCWTWIGSVDSKGYGRMTVRAKGVKRGASEGAYRVSWALHNGPIPEGMHVRHKCDNPICVNPAHLLTGTHADNMGDMRRRKRLVQAAGEDSPNAKLTWDQVRELRASVHHYDYAAMRAAAKRLGCTYQNVRAILRGLTWPERPAKTAAA